MNMLSELFGKGGLAPGDFPDPELDIVAPEGGGHASVVLAGGCFWCVEAVFTELEGVISSVSGYAGGTKETADYQTVCSGRTDHAEVVRITYDPQKISFGQILKVFFAVAHDPTQKDRQGNDMGRQYRSAVFYADDEQKRVTEAYIAQLDKAKAYPAPIVTTLEPLETFFDGENYHQNYAALNPHQPYIAYISMPKVQKLRATYPEKLKGK